MEGEREREMQHCFPPPNEFPWLVFCHGDGEDLSEQTFYSILEKTSYLRSIPELRGKKIHNSCHGWLILSTYELKDFSLFNPVTFESINLPTPKLDPTSDINDINACVLSLPPCHPDSTIFIFDQASRTISFCRLKNQCWFTHCYDEEIGVLSDCTNMDYNYLYLPISCNGKVYAVTLQREFLVSINMTEQDSIVLQRLVRFPNGRKEISSRSRSDLLEADGYILSIMTSYENKIEEFYLLPEQIIDVEIHKLDLSSLSWERVVNAKNQAFFLDNWCYQRSFSVSCSESLGNHVYFLQTFDDWLYSYHLDDCTVSTLVPCPNYPPIHRMAPIWIPPQRLAEFNGEAIQIFQKEHSGPEDTFEDQGNSATPWLISAHDQGRICRFTHPNICDKYSVNIPEPLQDASIWYCKDGWLLIGKEGDDVFCLSFFNPFNKEVIPYPELKGISVSVTRIGFSSPPTSQNCVVVVLEAILRPQIHICQSRTTGWQLFEFASEEFFPITNNYPVFADGAFYFLGSEGNLGFIRLHDECCKFKILEQPDKLEASYNEGFLAERDGEVFLVLTYEMGRRVDVLKLDHSTLNWERVTSLGKYSLHVSKSSALFMVAETSDAENKIYFPRFHGEHVVSYSLSTNCLESSGFECVLKDYEGTKQPLFCGWLKPNRS